MSRRSNAISDEMVEQCKLELKAQGVRGETGRRLQAILSAKKHGISAVAKIYSISRETLMRWIRKFQQEACKGFAVAKGRGAHQKLSESQHAEIKRYIINEGKNLTGRKLQNHIASKYSIQLGIATAYRLLKKLGFSYITPRPKHHKKDLQQQEEFKKKSPK